MTNRGKELIREKIIKFISNPKEKIQNFRIIFYPFEFLKEKKEKRKKKEKQAK
jgi:hypothetical protein